MSDKIVYRPINLDNFEEVRYFFITHEYSWRDSDPATFVARSEEKRDEVAKNYIEKLKDGSEKFYCLGAFIGDELIGSHFLDRYMIDGQKACHIHGLWIDSAYRNKGIAMTLKKKGEEWAKSKGCVLMDANVKVSNKNMISLNEKLGYEVARYNFRKRLD